MGFLTLGRMFDNNVHDILDDRIDVVTRGLLGLTVSCARCHDHKYDPIPQADYYSLYGVFAGSEAPLELPLLEPVATNPARAAFEKKAAPRRQALRAFLDSQYALLLETARKTRGRLPRSRRHHQARLAGKRPSSSCRWPRMTCGPRSWPAGGCCCWSDGRGPDDPVFGPWYDLIAPARAVPSRRRGGAAPGLEAPARRHRSGTAQTRSSSLRCKRRL